MTRLSLTLLSFVFILFFPKGLLLSTLGHWGVYLFQTGGGGYNRFFLCFMGWFFLLLLLFFPSMAQLGRAGMVGWEGEIF